MVRVRVFLIEGGNYGDHVVLRTEFVFSGGGGSLADDAKEGAIANKKGYQKSLSVVKDLLQPSRPWKSAFRIGVHVSFLNYIIYAASVPFYIKYIIVLL